MKRSDGGAVVAAATKLLAGGGCPAVSRRGFLAGCAACVAGATGLAARVAAATGAGDDRKLKIRLAFCHTTPDVIVWPNIGYDYEGRGNQLLAQLAPLCPEAEFLPVRVLDAKQAAQVMAADKEVDGYLVYVLGMRGGADALTAALGKAGRPMVVVEDHFCGPFSLGFNGRAAKAGWKAVCLATSRLQDVADAVHCLQIMRKPGATADDFLATARAVYKKNLAPMGDMTCAADPVPQCDVGKCIERLKASTIVVVGRDPGGLTKAILDEFGVKVVPIKHEELNAAFLKADPAEAAARADRWMKGAEKMLEATRDDVVKAGAMHLAMQDVMKKYDARAITINCLGGFYTGALQAFPCLGFVEFNNEGLVGGCEADLQSAITMLAVGTLTGRPGYISDPVIDTSNHQIIYAHCVAPTKVFGPEGPANPYHIRSHSEDRRGAAIRSILPLGYMVTSLKFIPGRREAVLHQAKTMANVDVDNACRTKLAAEVKGDINKLFSTWSNGWHRVTFYGDLKEPIAELAKALKITIIQEA
jgi:hypothetical protein